MKTEKMTYVDVCHAIRGLKNGKPPGEDFIAGEMLKATADGEGVRNLHELLSLIRNSEQCPKEWKRGKPHRMQQLERDNSFSVVWESYGRNYL